MITRSMTAFAVLSAAFLAMSAAVGLGGTTATDLTVANAVTRDWNPTLGVVAKAFAVLGGIEVTSLIVLGIAVYLWRRDFRSEAWFLVAFGAVEVLETMYKQFVFHPGPGPNLGHGDGPSITLLFEKSLPGNSFPSGHVVRTVFAYGMLAFVVRRLARPGSPWRAAAVPVAAIMILLMALDRVYLETHWESDVIGGLLLGGIGLAASVIWLDRPRVRASG